jgi:rod shape-determining protein MreD
MKTVAIVCVGLLLILVQGNLYRILGGFAALADPHSIAGQVVGVLTATPNLVLPLVIFLGVQEHSMVRGASLAFVLGHLVDVLGSEPMWLFTFVSVAIWWLARIFGVRLTAQTPLTRMPLVFGFAVVQGTIILILLAVFGADNRRPVEIAHTVLPNALTTALFSPIVFRIAQRLHQGNAPVAPTEGAPRA